MQPTFISLNKHVLNEACFYAINETRSTHTLHLFAPLISANVAEN
jgi:hypothetical protein